MGNGDEADARLARLLAVVEAQGAQLAALTSIVSAERSGPKPAPREATVADVHDRFRAAYQGRPCWKIARNRLTPFVEYFGADNVSAVTPTRWPAYREMRKMAQGRKAGMTLSPLTINFELDWAKRMFNWAMEPEQAMIASNPLAIVKREKTRTQRETWLTEEDVQAALSTRAPRNERIRAAIHAWFINVVDTGLRFNEMRKLRRDRCRIRPDGSVLADVGRTKNGKTHFVALTTRGWEALQRIDHVLGSPLFFANGNTTRLYSERTMRRWFREMVESAGLDSRVADGDVRLRPHDGRRTAATAADRRGASLSAIQEMLNHSTPAITVRYIRRSEESAVAISRLMEAGAARERSETEAARRGPKGSPNVPTLHTQTAKK